MKQFLDEQKEFLFETYDKLEMISDGEASSKQNDKWSRKEILGHLIDSASNNHQRFVRAQFSNDLIFPGYNQDEWVRVQCYQEVNWHALIELWKSFNFLLIHDISRIPEVILTNERITHNLDEIAWKTVPANEPTTLEYFIKDYFGHMRHHINQLFTNF